MPLLYRLSFVFVLCGLCVSLVGQQAIDPHHQWGQWRGPISTGEAPHADPPVTWSDDSNIAWKVATEGEGIATPIVWGDRVFLVSAVPTDRVGDSPPTQDERALTQTPPTVFQFKVICLNLETGKKVWENVAIEKVPHEGRHKTSAYAAASPMTDGQQLIVSFGSIGIFSYSLEGEKQWSIDLGDMHTRKGWGEATSPVLVDGKVVMNWDNEDQSFIYTLDAENGDTVWKVVRDEPTTWATPLIIERDGKKQVVTNGTNQIVAYDLASGEEVWNAKGTTLNAIPCPVPFQDKVIFMGGYRGHRAVSIQVGSQGQSEQIWELGRGTPYVPSPLLLGSRLYYTQGNQMILRCANVEDGELIFGPQRLTEGRGGLYGSPVSANGRIYIASREGTTVVFDDADTYKLLSSNKLDDQFDASPVPVGDRLLLRGRKFLYCIQEKAE